MSDDLVKEIAKGALRIEWKDTESAARRVAEHAADRIEELEDKLANIAHTIWTEHKDWEGERKYALRQIVKWLVRADRD